MKLTSTTNMSLTGAKMIADAPEKYTVEQLRSADKRLLATKTNGGVLNSERAQRRLSDRLARLSGELARRLANG